MDDQIIETLALCGKEFQENELAYLALTTKIELPVRDRWAFLLHKKLGSKYHISREWRRTDLAILDGVSPIALVELKAMYSFDAAFGDGGGKGYTDKMLRDENKAKKLAGANTDVYTVLLSTHPRGGFDKRMNYIVKYLYYINKSLKKYVSETEVLSRCKAGVSRNLKDRILLTSGEFDGGSAFGVDVLVSYWVVKAKNVAV